eukprot:516350_1
MAEIRPKLDAKLLIKLCPYRNHQEKSLTSEQSKKLHPQLKLTRESGDIKPQEQFFLFCMKGKCAKKPLKHKKLIKAKLYGEHLTNYHDKEPYEGYDKEILVFSHWTLSIDKKRYKREYALIDITSNTSYRHIIVPPNKSPFNVNAAAAIQYSEVTTIDIVQNQEDQLQEPQQEEKKADQSQQQVQESLDKYVSKNEYNKLVDMVQKILECVEKKDDKQITHYMSDTSTPPPLFDHYSSASLQSTVYSPSPVLCGKLDFGGIKVIKQTKKKTCKKRKETFNICIYKVLKQVHPDIGISKRAMAVMNGFVHSTFDRIATEAG